MGNCGLCSSTSPSELNHKPLATRHRARAANTKPNTKPGPRPHARRPVRRVHWHDGHSIPRAKKKTKVSTSKQIKAGKLQKGRVDTKSRPKPNSKPGPRKLQKRQIDKKSRPPERIHKQAPTTHAPVRGQRTGQQQKKRTSETRGEEGGAEIRESNTCTMYNFGFKSVVMGHCGSPSTSPSKPNHKPRVDTKSRHPERIRKRAPITHTPARGQCTDHSENRDELQTSHIFVEPVNIQEYEEIAFGLEVDDEVEDENEYAYPHGDSSEEGGADYEDLEQEDVYDESEEGGADHEDSEQEDEYDSSEEGGADYEGIEQEDENDDSEEGGANYEDSEQEDEYDDEERGANYEDSEQEDEYDDSEERGADYEGIEQEDEHDDREEGGADYEDLEQEDGYGDSGGGGAYHDEDEYDDSEDG